MKRRIAIILLSVSVTALAAWGITTAVQSLTPAPPLAAYLPQGALLTIESPDFATLLSDWRSSPQAAAWLKSDDYAVFSRSHLFGRLSDAESEFFATASLPTSLPDIDLLHEVAGKESIFAWYDIGNLEFLYITKLPPGQATQTHLMQARDRFSRRQVGNSVFYVRTQDPAPADSEETSDSAGSSKVTQTRTVAFAVSGDWLLLSTREDLMAGALQLLEKSTTESVARESLATAPWYADAQKLSANQKSPAALHMTLALDRIAETPQFRSHWIQQDITELGQYRAAVSDLYRDAGQLREERVLIPKTVSDAPETSTSLAHLAALVPAGTGVFRAVALPNDDEVASAIEEKLLARSASTPQDSTQAPNADLTPEPTGTASDLEVRIDAVDQAPPAPTPTKADPLAQALAAQHLDAMLTLDTASSPATPEDLWVPIHSAVVLHATQPIDASTLKNLLTASLNSTLSAGTLGVGWHEQQESGHTWSTLTGPHTLVLSVDGNTAILANDPALLAAMLSAHTTPAENKTDKTAKTATYIAGFDHTSQRAPYARLTSLIDHTNTRPDPGQQQGAPAFFSGNLRSLSDAFAAFRSERIVIRPDGPNLRQTVLWQYQPE